MPSVDSSAGSSAPFGVVGAVKGNARIERGMTDPGRMDGTRSVTERTIGPSRHGRSSARLSPTGVPLPFTGPSEDRSARR